MKAERSAQEVWVCRCQEQLLWWRDGGKIIMNSIMKRLRKIDEESEVEHKLSWNFIEKLKGTRLIACCETGESD